MTGDHLSPKVNFPAIVFVMGAASLMPLFPASLRQAVVAGTRVYAVYFYRGVLERAEKYLRIATAHGKGQE